MPKKHCDFLHAGAMSPVKEYLAAVQRDGTELCASDVFCNTVSWLKSKGVQGVVPEQLVEQYALSVARWIHLEAMISKYGYIAKHPTTGAPVQSPYVAMAQSYAKQTTILRSEINELIKSSRPVYSETLREVVYGG